MKPFDFSNKSQSVIGEKKWDSNSKNEVVSLVEIQKTQEYA